jgi:hypothetical protein
MSWTFQGFDYYGFRHVSRSEAIMARMAALSARLVERRTVLKTGFAWGAIEVAFPFTIRGRGEQLVKIGMVEPLSGVYSKLAEW